MHLHHVVMILDAAGVSIVRADAGPLVVDGLHGDQCEQAQNSSVHFYSTGSSESRVMAHILLPYLVIKQHALTSLRGKEG